jgi:riboflavin synthase
MFSGIVEAVAPVSAVRDGRDSRRLTLRSVWTDCAVGQSVAVNGCCLTIAEVLPGELVFDIVRETLDRTNLGLLGEGAEVNLERALRLSDRVDGHLVQGHIDGTASLLEQPTAANQWRMRLRSPQPLVKYLVPKGSVCLDGVSLTIASIDRSDFEVALVPTTLERTTLAKKLLGWRFNLETDILAKTVVAWLERQQALPGGLGSSGKKLA